MSKHVDDVENQISQYWMIKQNYDIEKVRALQCWVAVELITFLYMYLYRDKDTDKEVQVQMYFCYLKGPGCNDNPRSDQGTSSY